MLVASADQVTTMQQQIDRLSNSLNKALDELYEYKLDEWRGKSQDFHNQEHITKYCMKCRNYDGFCTYYTHDFTQDRNFTYKEVLEPIKDVYEIKENICSQFSNKEKTDTKIEESVLISSMKKDIRRVINDRELGCPYNFAEDCQSKKCYSCKKEFYKKIRAKYEKSLDKL